MDNNSSQELPLLTYNSLYNLLREEKKTRVLQNLPELFYDALKKYFEDKKNEIDKLKKDDSQKDKLRKERLIFSNSKKIAQELLNLRCVKICNIAIKNTLFGEEILSKDDVLGIEEDFFKTVETGVKKINKFI